MEPKVIALPKLNLVVIEYSLFATAFFIPLFISGPQLLTGSIVNTLLFLYISQHSSSQKLVPILILPSIGAVLNGILFGKFTMFLLYFLPFIWVGNYLLVKVFKNLFVKNTFFVAVLGSALIKFAFLFSTAYLLILMKIVPLIFLQLMGILQLYTAIIGGIIALVIHTIISKTNDR